MAGMIFWLAFGIAGAGFALLAAILLALGWSRSQSRLFAFAAGLHSLWAFNGFLSPIEGFSLMDAPAARFIETAHYLGWAAFLASLLPVRRAGLPRAVLVGGAILLVLRLLLSVDFGLPYLTGARLTLTVDLLAVALTLAAILGVFQAAGDSERWSLKFLCFPLGALFAYDLFLYAHALAIALPEREFVAMRPVLNAMAVPLVFVAAARRRFWREEFFVSRQAAIYSVTLIGIGAYLLLVAAAALTLEQFSEAASLPLQVTVAFGAVLFLLFILSSGRTRAKVKLLVGRHFYARKYDYAHEWRKFMQTLAVEQQSSTLENRIIRACANIVEVPGGALWAMEGGRTRLEAAWNFRPERSAPENVTADMFRTEDGDFGCLYGEALAESPLARDPQAWLAVPLPHGSTLVGFLVLSRPRARHRLEAEDKELVMLVARQCAIFMAERRAATELEQNKQFARFNRQYAFVAHDIKNLISQLSVMLRNFDRHASNPEFQRDMHDTVSNAVQRMQKLIGRLTRLDAGDGSADATETVRVHDLVSHVVEERSGSHALTVEDDARDAIVSASSDRLGAILGHLLTNAHEASGPGGAVGVHLGLSGRYVIIEISDDGPGMSEDFIRDGLFVPFRSTKDSGFGVGAFQCREFAREQGGDLDVVSSPGHGTTMRLRLPVQTERPQRIAAQS